MVSKFYVSFKENGDEFEGMLTLDCEEVVLSAVDDCVFYADGIRIEIDEPIVKATDEDNNIITEAI